MNNLFPKMVDLVPEGRVGGAKVEHFEVSATDSAFSAIRGRDNYVPSGKYARLFVNGCLMMSDTDMERRTNEEVVSMSYGDVLIAGLGLGMIVHAIAARSEVSSVLVIEKYQDVIDLIGPTLPPKVTVVCADIFTWKPEKFKKWSTIYFDIWPFISLDNLKEIVKLHRRYGHYKRLGGWMGSWQYSYLKYRKKKDEKAERRWRW